MITIPTDNREQRLIFKTVGEREVELLFYPPTHTVYEQAPLLFLIPGGGWCLSVAESMYGMARSLAETLREAGFAVASTSYRNHRDDGVMMPAIVTDVFDAASFLAQHADVLGIDPHRMYTGGHSAGGHLALMLAFAPCDFGEERTYHTPFTVRGCVPISPPTRLLRTKEELPRYAEGVAHLFQGCSDDAFAQYSPLCWAQNGHGVPTLAAVGDRDTLVVPAHSEDLCDALNAHHIAATLLVSHGGGHCLEPIETDAVSIPLSDALLQMAAFVKDLNAQ